jgi:hypothetical protein
MEQEIWAELVNSQVSFLSVDAVECGYPSCEIRYVSDGRSAVMFQEIVEHFDNDDQGMPIVRQMGHARREVAPGYEMKIFTFSIEAP